MTCFSTQVGYSECDVGITVISYSQERNSFIDYSHPVGQDGPVWLSKPPQKLPPSTNIVRVFDSMTWLFVFVSMVTVSLMLLIASQLGIQYGVGTSDVITLLLTPFQTLNAESLPTWFIKKDRTTRVFSPGFSGNFILLMWAVMGSLIALAFMSNIRAMLLKPVYEQPIETTKDIFDVGRIPIIKEGSFFTQYFKTSENPWQRLAYEKRYSISLKDKKEEERVTKEEVHNHGTHVILKHPEKMAYSLNHDEFYKGKSVPIFHASKKSVR